MNKRVALLSNSLCCGSRILHEAWVINFEDLHAPDTEVFRGQLPFIGSCHSIAGVMAVIVVAVIDEPSRKRPRCVSGRGREGSSRILSIDEAVQAVAESAFPCSISSSA